MRLARLTLVCCLFTPTLALPDQVTAYSIATSHERTVFRIIVANEPSAVLTSQNGGMIRLAIVGLPTLGLIPTLNRDGTLQMLLTQIAKDPATGNEQIREVGTLKMQRGQTLRHDVIGIPLEIEWLGTLPPSITQKTSPTGPCTICCVTCGQATLCACLVEMWCGTCCCPDACDCDNRSVSSAQGNAGARQSCTTGSLRTGTSPANKRKEL